MKIAEIIERTLNLDVDVENALDRMFNLLDAVKVTVIVDNKTVDVVTAAEYENYFDVENFVDCLLYDADAVNASEFTFVADYEF